MFKALIASVIILAAGAAIAQDPSKLATCKPLAKGKCKACKNCKYCKHCNESKGKCSVCADERAQRIAKTPARAPKVTKS